MKIAKTYILFIILVLSTFSCRNTKNLDKTISADFDQTIYHLAKSYISPLPHFDINTLGEDQKKIVELGKSLYYEKKLSGDQTISCASCHNLTNYGVDNKVFSLGNNNQKGKRNALTVLNTFLYGQQNWDTKFKSVEEQAAGPIFNKLEMAMPDSNTLVDRLNADRQYQIAFARAFPTSKPHISVENVTKAIGAFERTLVTPAKFDKYLNGNLKVLNDNEKLGVYSFVMNCKSCHSSALVGGGFSVKYPIFGSNKDFAKNDNIDYGKFDITHNPNDKYVFKVPQLRNVEKTFPYMHDGSIGTLEEAIRICGQAESNIRLDEKDVNHIAAFLRTLTGKVPEYALEEKKLFH